MKRLQIESIAFLGAGTDPATVQFQPGLNVVHGASETGKSFLVDAIDFMFGGSTPLRDIPQRTRFDRVRMALLAQPGDAKLIFERPISGGAYRQIETNDITDLTAETVKTLKPQHSGDNLDSLSHYLLSVLGLDNKIVRKNASGEPRSLSLRHIAHLVVVGEEKIQSVESPFLSGSPNRAGSAACVL